MREPLTWTKKLRLRRWVLKELAREHGELVRVADDQTRRDEFTRHAARASALVRIFEVTGRARDEIAFLVLEHPIQPSAWDPAYQAMRVEVERKLASLGLPVRAAARPAVEMRRSVSPRL
jgi:hypothetical protein